MGYAQLLNGELEKSDASLLLAQQLLRESGNLRRLAVAETYLGDLRAKQGKKGDAMSHYTSARDLYVRVKLTRDVARMEALMKALGPAAE